jgi:hypothetical protein
MVIHTQVWKAVYGKSADAIEKSVENADECEADNPDYLAPHLNPSIPDMIIDNDPPIERNISVPRDMGGLSCSSFTAGIVEAVLDGLGFVCLPPLLALFEVLMLLLACTSDCTWHADTSTPLSNNYTYQTRKVCIRTRRAAKIMTVTWYCSGSLTHT